MADPREINDIYECLVKPKFNVNFTLKDEQLKAIACVVNHGDCIVTLPTGYGKSVCYYMTPLIMNAIDEKREAVVLVVSPLKALMADQVEILHTYGISSTCIVKREEMQTEDIESLKRCLFRVVFSSPEAVISPFWRKIFLSDIWQKRVAMVAFDETHCVSQWGDDFRPEYKKVSVLRSIFSCPFMALSATMTKDILKDVVRALLLNTPSIIAVLPDRPNIALCLEKCQQEFDKVFQWLLLLLKEENSQKVIVFCRSISQTSELYAFLMESLGHRAYNAETKSIENRKIDMFHAALDKETKDRILSTFKEKNSHIRCLVCTIAFGMGVDIPDVKVVVNWGAPSSLLQYWQQVGRCCRDGEQGFSVVYVYPRSVMKGCVTDEMRGVCKGDECVRSKVLEKFALGTDHLYEMFIARKRNNCKGCEEKACLCDYCKCCNICSRLCQCPNKFQETELFLKKNLDIH